MRFMFPKLRAALLDGSPGLLFQTAPVASLLSFRILISILFPFGSCVFVVVLLLKSGSVAEISEAKTCQSILWVVTVRVYAFKKT